MRVLQVHNKYRDFGGEDAVVNREYRLLGESGIDVIQWAVENSESPIRAGLDLAMAPWNPFMHKKAMRLFREAKPDLVHIHNTWFSLSPAVIWAARHCGIPVVMTAHNYRLSCANAQFFRNGAPCELCLTGTNLNAVRYRCYRDSAVLSAPAAVSVSLNSRVGTWSRNVDRLLVLTDFARTKMIHAGFPEERLVVRHNSAKDPGQRPKPPSQSDYLLFVGRLSEQKGVDCLVRAWRQAQPEKLRLVIIGDGPQRSVLTHIVNDCTEFLGPQDPETVMNYMLNARAVAVPSLSYEGAPLAIVEALAAGTPVLTSNIGGLPEMVGQDKAGWLAEPGQLDSWTVAMQQLKDGSALDQRGREARRRYEALYSESASARSLLDIYSAVTGHHDEVSS